MSLALALALGLAADSSFREGRAYLLNTPDKARSVRSACFEQAAKEFAGVFPVDVLETGAIERRRDVLFYFARPDSSARSD